METTTKKRMFGWTDEEWKILNFMILIYSKKFAHTPWLNRVKGEETLHKGADNRLYKCEDCE
tara:strand:- start:2176 stop:2361 length:186 start_codon:yes stop_codon:yes gene_type:complete